jgi:hypothetical protein
MVNLNTKIIVIITVITFTIYICGCNATYQLKFDEQTEKGKLNKLSLIETKIGKSINFDSDTLRDVNYEYDSLIVIGQSGSILVIPSDSLNKFYYYDFSYPRTIGAVVMGSMFTVFVAAISFRLYLDSLPRD